MNPMISTDVKTLIDLKNDLPQPLTESGPPRRKIYLQTKKLDQLYRLRVFDFIKKLKGLDFMKTPKFHK